MYEGDREGELLKKTGVCNDVSKPLDEAASVAVTEAYILAFSEIERTEFTATVSGEGEWIKGLSHAQYNVGLRDDLGDWWEKGEVVKNLYIIYNICSQTLTGCSVRKRGMMWGRGCTRKKWLKNRRVR